MFVQMCTSSIRLNTSAAEREAKMNTAIWGKAVASERPPKIISERTCMYKSVSTLCVVINRKDP